MREHKYRGKRIDGKWVYGDLLTNCNNQGHDCTMIKDTRSNINNGICDIIPTEVDPETVGEFTGRHDASNTELYEGDLIVGGIKKEYCLIKWDKNCARFIARGPTYKVLGHKFPLFKKVGNIYDNPEIR